MLLFYIDLRKEISKNANIIVDYHVQTVEQVYNTAIEENKPKVENLCDDCQSTLVKREDDTEEIFESRYQVYLDETKPLVDFYAKENLLYRIDGNLDKM